MTNAPLPNSGEVGNQHTTSAASEAEGSLQCRPDQLWVPGMHLDEIYPAATPQELREAWEQYDGRTAVAVEGLLGVYVPPVETPRGIASIDLCEVVRETAMALDHANAHPEPTRRSGYSNDRWYSAETAGSPMERSVVVSIVQTIMNNTVIPPTENIDEIRAFLQQWRAKGVYVIANTSTLPGCEVATITKQLKETLPDCFDGVLFPRTHDGTLPMTKARALETFAQEASIDIHKLPILHIDDGIHHVTGFADHYPHHNDTLYAIPRHADNTHAPIEYLSDSPRAAFERADEFLNLQGVL